MALVQAAAGMVQNIVNQLPGAVVTYTKFTEYCKDISDFANLKSDVDTLEPPDDSMDGFQSLEFRSVRFAYPGTAKYILDGISFTIENGKHYAFVGINGAGKTTIIKLILGFYPEYEGQILVNGEDIKHMGQRRRKALVSALFQDFAQYPLTFEENISIGDAVHARGEAIHARVMEACTQIGLDQTIDALPDGMSTPLGRYTENAQDLSGGQWQRVAIARTIVSPAPIHILDEPTSAADPVSESELYREFEEISQGWTTIFISHRLASTKLADKIFLIHEGKITESGTHEDLMRSGGMYCEMYESQRSWYKWEN